MKDSELDIYLKRNVNYIKDDSIIERNVNSMLKSVNFKKEKTKEKRILKKLKLATLPILLSSAVVFAVGINTFNLSSVGINENSINLAIKNNYIQEVNMAQTSDDLMIKIDKFIVDDINMDIGLEISSSKYDLDNIKNIYIRDLKITDENNNQIFAETEKQTNNIALTYGYTKIEKKNNNTISNAIFLKSNNFPKSKTINISFSEIELHYKNKDLIINGIWNYNFDVNEEMKKRANIEYDIVSEKIKINKNNDYLKIIDVKLTNTGLIIGVESNNVSLLNKMKFYLNINGNKVYSNNDKIENIKNYTENSVEYIYNFSITKYDTPYNFELVIESKYFKGNFIVQAKNK